MYEIKNRRRLPDFLSRDSPAGIDSIFYRWNHSKKGAFKGKIVSIFIVHPYIHTDKEWSDG